MKSEWKLKKLSEIAEIYDSLHQTPRYAPIGVPMVRVTDIRTGLLSLNRCLRVEESVFRKFTVKHIPQKHDIVISRVGSYGNFSLVSDDQPFCLGQNTAIIAPKINALYLYYFLISDFVKHQIEQKVVGSTQKTISLKSIKELDVLVPDERIQNKIASLLWAIDDKIELNNRINENLEKQAQAIYASMFFDIQTDGWMRGTLSDIAEITMGQSPSGNSYNEDGNGTVFFQGRAEFGLRFPTVRLYTTEPKRMARKKDVLMSVRAPVGNLNVAHEDCCIGRGLSAIHSKDNHQSFILYTMFSLQKELNVFNGEGTIFGSINRDSLNGMPIVIPPMEKIDKFEAIVAPMDELILSNYDANCCLAQIRDTIFPKLMSGKLDVSEVAV